MASTDHEWDFFLAHAGSDLRTAELLYAHLRAESRVFLDSCCLRLGDDWDVKLARAQRRSLVTVVLVSEHAEDAYYQREEVAAAICFARDDPSSHRVVPIYIDTTASNPRVPYGLRLKHGLVLDDRFTLADAATRLLELRREVLGSASPPPEDPPGDSTPRRSSESGAESALELIAVLSGHDHIIHRISWSPDGRFLATTSRDMTARIWELDRPAQPEILGGNQRWVNAVTWAPDGSRVALGLEDGRIRIWRVSGRDWHLATELQAHNMRVECLDWAPDGRVLASASADYSVGIWDADSLASIRRIKDHQNWVNVVAFSPSGGLLATGAEDEAVRCWDGLTYAHQRTLQSRDWVSDLAWSPDDGMLAAASRGGLHVWSMPDGRLVRKLQLDTKVRAVSFSADGQLLASKSSDDLVRIWCARTWRCLTSFSEPTVDEENPESILRFHPRRPILATLGERDRIVRLWRLPEGWKR